MEDHIQGNAIKTNPTVLIFSEDAEAARVWAFSLKNAGMDVCLAGFSEKSLQIWSDEFPDLLVLEDHNASVDVFEFCRRLRAETSLPILVLTSINHEAHILKAYEAGANDCLPHPLTPRLFVAKVKAWLRFMLHAPTAALEQLQVGHFHLDVDQSQLTLPGGKAVKLTNLEFRVLYLLMNHPGWVLESGYLVDRAWGHYASVDNALLKNVIYRLRKKIEPQPSQPRYLVTVGSLGYKFQVPGVTPASQPVLGNSRPADPSESIQEQAARPERAIVERGDRQAVDSSLAGRSHIRQTGQLRTEQLEDQQH
jgi:two-component system, OmpR family, response regulator RegX3